MVTTANLDEWVNKEILRDGSSRLLNILFVILVLFLDIYLMYGWWVNLHDLTKNNVPFVARFAALSQWMRSCP